jgi:hypothetical protein
MRPATFVLPAFVLLLAASGPAARAQFRPDTLDAALKDAAPYDAARSGPLLAVAPALARLADGAPSAAGKPGTEPLRDLAPLYRRRIARLGTVAALVPETMVVLQAPPVPPEEWAARPNRASAARRLAASLTPAQWALLGGPRGLGAGDLTTPEQRDLFAALLPQPFRVKRVTAAENGAYVTRVNGQDVTGAPFELTPAQIAGVRLRAVRSMTWGYGFKEQPGTRIGYGTPTGAAPAPGTEFAILDRPSDGRERQDALLAAVRRVEPNRLKRGDLPLDGPAMARPVVLAGAERLGDLVRRAAEVSGVELYADRRVASLPVVVYAADGQTARAGDVLRALCLSVCGAFRRVSDPSTGEAAYILTEDRGAGLAARRLRWADWWEDVQALESDRQGKEEAALRDAGAASHVGFDPANPYGLDAATMRSVEADVTRPRRPGEFYSDSPIPVAALPPAAQAVVKQQLENHAHFNGGAGAGGNEIITDRVFANFSVGTRLVVPGVGEFDGPALSSLPSLLPRPAPAASASPTPAGPASVPPSLARPAALLAAPRSAAEAEVLVREAAAHGFTALWVDVPAADGEDAPRADAALAAAVAAGARANVAVGAAVRAFRVPAGGAAGATPDINLFGEKSSAYAARRAGSPWLARYYRSDLETLRGTDWLAPDDPKARAAVVARVKALAHAAPGLAAVVVRDAVPPGYGQGPETAGYYNRSLAGRYLGYSPAHRLAAVRRENVDPVDLLPLGGTPGPYLPVLPDGEPAFPPFFPGEEDGYSGGGVPAPPVRYVRDPKTGAWSREDVTGRTLNDGWNAVRADAARAALSALRRELADALPPSLPVIWAAPEEGNGGGSLSPWCAGWPADPPAPPAYADRKGGQAAGRQPWLLSLYVSERSTPEGVARGVSRLPERARLYGGTWSGFVLDAATVPASAVPKLLSRLSQVR